MAYCVAIASQNASNGKFTKRLQVLSLFKAAALYSRSNNGRISPYHCLLWYGSVLPTAAFSRFKTSVLANRATSEKDAQGKDDSLHANLKTANIHPNHAYDRIQCREETTRADHSSGRDKHLRRRH
ncbi:hypothetical protein ANCDUO_16962 [Ancylostoma duodenale]|uniref:Uncharacterized protein n=1 Tax=Ancylostoma duodenale TaxID=51022 RepID=A0A0C2G7B5_9BILA|nr:hypothetical protein ANCDUO_16962 [Ancylostoma duodenale]